MDKVDFREIWPQLIGLVPVYARDSTNGTEIRLENRSPLYSPFRTKTLVRRLARVFTIDLRAARDRYGEVCGRCYAIPIPLRPGLVMVPVHARYARVKDDGTRAYVVKSKIAGFNRLPPGGSQGPDTGRADGTANEEEMRTRLVFTDGSHLDVPHDMQGIRSLLLLAEKVEKEAESLHGRMEPSCVAEPALKGYPAPDCLYRPCSRAQRAPATGGPERDFYG